MFYAFRDQGERAAFAASRYRRDIVVPRLTRSVHRFEDYKLLLQPLTDFIAARGRLPDIDELPETADVISALGSLKRAFRLIQSATGAEAWAEIAAKRAQDRLIYLALARFDRRPTLSQLPLALQRDVKALFPSYGQACKQADALLFSVGRTEEVNATCSNSPIGKKMPEALYIHVSAIDRLPASLRVFEGCARTYIGRVDSANIVKLSRLEPKISYLSYPAFDEDPHPALTQSLSVNLQTFRVRTRDYSEYRNPPDPSSKRDVFTRRASAAGQVRKTHCRQKNRKAFWTKGAESGPATSGGENAGGERARVARPPSHLTPLRRLLRAAPSTPRCAADSGASRTGGRDELRLDFLERRFSNWPDATVGRLPPCAAGRALTKGVVGFARAPPWNARHQGHGGAPSAAPIPKTPPRQLSLMPVAQECNQNASLLIYVLPLYSSHALIGLGRRQLARAAMTCATAEAMQGRMVVG